VPFMTGDAKCSHTMPLFSSVGKTASSGFLCYAELCYLGGREKWVKTNCCSYPLQCISSYMFDSTTYVEISVVPCSLTKALLSMDSYLNWWFC
jgi:hypothetical protein